jgi:hypothetical protein
MCEVCGHAIERGTCVRCHTREGQTAEALRIYTAKFCGSLKAGQDVHHAVRNAIEAVIDFNRAKASKVLDTRPERWQAIYG